MPISGHKLYILQSLLFFYHNVYHFRHKNYKAYTEKEKWTHCQEIRHLTEPDLDMPRYRNYIEISMINMLNNLVEKLDNVHDQQI